MQWKNRFLAPSFLLLAYLPLIAQVPVFTLLPTGETSPAGREDGTIAYDSKRKAVWMFGGRGNAPGVGAYGDIWRYDLDANRWTELSPTGTRPPARWGHTLTYDPLAEQLLVVGGQASGLFSDVWSYSIATNQWRQLAADNEGPSRRYSHSTIYDARRRRLVLSHGFTNSGRFDDTWAFDLTSNRWSNITPANAKPLRRCLHHAVVDAAGDQMLLFGGCASGFGPCPLDDLWSFDLARGTWRQLNSTRRPAGRQWYGMAFDEDRKRLVINSGSGRGTLADTWEYDVAEGDWREIATNSPPARSRHQGIYAPELKVSFFFGGSTNTGFTNELWQYGLPAASASPISAVTDVFAFRDQAVSPGQLVSIFGKGLAEGELLINQRQANILFRSETQINALVPYEVAGASVATFAWRKDGAILGSLQIPLRAATPTLFPGSVLPDGTLNSATNRVAAGDIVLFFGTGHGVLTAGSPAVPQLPVSMRIADQPIELLYAGMAPGFVGLLQVNARVSASLPAGDHEVSLRVGEVASQPGVKLFVK